VSNKSRKDVGYGRPPRHSRFKPGQSGNPRGRPKGTSNFATDLEQTLAALITLNEGGKSKRVSTQRAALLRLREMALKGNVRALEKLLSFAAASSASETADARSPSGEDQAILDAFRQEILAEANDATERNDDKEDA
jgi:uncharacterized protein DUF5681